MFGSEAAAPLRVLFLCTHNSARSQMAEGMLRAWGGDGYVVRSAGTQATSVRPQTITVMDELGIDLLSHASEHLLRYLGEPFDWVITVCEDARETCPAVPGANAQEHRAFEEPSAAAGTQEERLTVFRRVRDEIAARIREFLRRREEPVTTPPSAAGPGPA